MSHINMTNSIKLRKYEAWEQGITGPVVQIMTLYLKAVPQIERTIQVLERQISHTYELMLWRYVDMRIF